MACCAWVSTLALIKASSQLSTIAQLNPSDHGFSHFFLDSNQESLQQWIASLPLRTQSFVNYLLAISVTSLIVSVAISMLCFAKLDHHHVSRL